MQRHFDDELQQLKNDILKMGALAQEAIVNAVDALKNRDKAAAKKVINSDVEMDRLELVIDEKCLDLIVLHQPMARDLRFITTAIKMNAELERIALDQRVLLAWVVREAVQSYLVTRWPLLEGADSTANNSEAIVK